MIAAIGVGLLHAASQLPGLHRVVLCVLALRGLAISVTRLLPRGAVRAERGLSSVIVLRGIASAAFFGAEVFIPLLLSREYGLQALWAGAVLMIGSFVWSYSPWYQGHTRRQWSRTQLLQTGMSLMALGIFVSTAVAASMMFSTPTWATHVVIVASLVSWTLTGLGMGLVSPRARSS